MVYGGRRTCDPRTGSDLRLHRLHHSGLQRAEHRGPDGPWRGRHPGAGGRVGVTAPDTYTVQFTVGTPAAYFPAIAGMWVNRPQYPVAIEAQGERWTEPGFMVSNGPYALVSWFHGDNLALEKNPLLVRLGRGQGQHRTH